MAKKKKKTKKSANESVPTSTATPTATRDSVLRLFGNTRDSLIAPSWENIFSFSSDDEPISRVGCRVVESVDNDKETGGNGEKESRPISPCVFDGVGWGMHNHVARWKKKKTKENVLVPTATRDSINEALFGNIGDSLIAPSCESILSSFLDDESISVSQLSPCVFTRVGCKVVESVDEIGGNGEEESQPLSPCVFAGVGRGTRKHVSLEQTPPNISEATMSPYEITISQYKCVSQPSFPYKKGGGSRLKIKHYVYSFSCYNY